MSQHPQGPPPGRPTGPPHGTTAPQAPYPGPAQPEPPAPPKQNWFARHKILTGVLAVFAFFVVIGIATSGDGDEGTSADSGRSAETSADSAAQEPEQTDDEDAASAQEEVATEEDTEETSSDAAADAAPQDDEPAEAGIGETVSDGDFEFVVTEIETGVGRIGSEFLNEQPQGQFVLVYLEATNTGSSAETFWTSDQGLVDTEGRTHSADDSAAHLLDDGEFLLTEINPGNTARAALVFDIPADAEAAAVELHGSMFSRGVTVNLQ